MGEVYAQNMGVNIVRFRVALDSSVQYSFSLCDCIRRVPYPLWELRFRIW